MKRLFNLSLLLASQISFAQKQIEPGLVDLEPEGITTMVTDMAINPNNNKLFLIGTNGRAYQFDVSTKGKLVNDWKTTDINSVKSGAIAHYTLDGKYIVLRGYGSTIAKTRSVLFSKYQKAWQNTDDMGVLDATTGKEILNVSNAFAISISGNTAFVSDKDGFKWYSLLDGNLIKEQKVDENEYAAISPSGKYIVESWDADKQSMKDIPSVNRRRTELKNAYRAKKVLVIYNANDLAKPIAYSNDEVDVVTNMIFDADEKFVYLQMQLGGQEDNTNPNNFIFQRVNLTTGEIDKTFGCKGNFCKLSNNGKVSSLFNDGTLGMLRQLRVVDMNNGENYAQFITRYKLFKNSTLLCPVALASNSNTAYVYYEKHLFEWDYSKVKKYFKKSAGASDEELANKADSMLDKSLEDVNCKLYKEIQKQGIKGDYIMDITIVGPKGAVQTVFCESDAKTNIAMQNALKDLIRKQEFDLGLPKDRRVKFRYTFQL